MYSHAFHVGGMEKTKSSVNSNSRKSVGQEYCLDHTHYCITGQQTRTSQHTTQTKFRLDQLLHKNAYYKKRDLYHGAIASVTQIEALASVLFCFSFEEIK